MRKASERTQWFKLLGPLLTLKGNAEFTLIVGLTFDVRFTIGRRKWFFTTAPTASLKNNN